MNSLLETEIQEKGEGIMQRYGKDDIFRMVEEEDVEFIRLQFTDIFGMLKNVAITSSQLKKALDNRCMFDGSSIEGFVRMRSFRGGPSRARLPV